ncbi:MAG: biotin--[acetyl-CoA-carboxylase] ligase [Clostridiales bacterium]|nr:biotin--[acetyl-CoA-carboxylase] ligase [Clostridiales bacterium]
MNTKDQLISLFENNKGEYLSGEAIAEKLTISRAAVWKAVQSLRSEGYNICAVPNKGYSLSLETDIVSPQGIAKYLNVPVKIEVYPTLSSTNTTAREKAIQGGPECVVIANSQTGGKGRNGHTFYAPSDTGLYMSILLRPHNYPAYRAVKLTTIAAVATCEAIEAISDVHAEIKWVNDIFVNGKKVCGILTEAGIGVENGFLEYAVVGIGINLSPPKGGFPDDIKDIAGTIFDGPQSDGKNRLAAEVLNRFLSYYEHGSTDYVDSYRRRSLVIGKEINVIKPDSIVKAIALDVDDDCHLIVRYGDGKTESLSSGEISVKL